MDHYAFLHCINNLDRVYVIEFIYYLVILHFKILIVFINLFIFQ
jgi:hypothetical protein